MSLEGWSDFFVAGAGASAALAGLIIVAMSVSVDLIIAIPGMPSRAASAVALLVLATLVCLAGLIPQQTVAIYGVETTVLAAGGLAFTIDSMVRVLRHRGTSSIAASLIKTLIEVLPAVLFATGGIVLATGSTTGAFWVAFGIVTAVMVSVTNAWVVLVEIKR